MKLSKIIVSSISLLLVIVFSLMSFLLPIITNLNEAVTLKFNDIVNLSSFQIFLILLLLFCSIVLIFYYPNKLVKIISIVILFCFATFLIYIIIECFPVFKEESDALGVVTYQLKSGFYVNIIFAILLYLIGITGAIFSFVEKNNETKLEVKEDKID